MRGKGGERGFDGLRVANVGQECREDGETGRRGGDGQPGLGHHGEEGGGFEMCIRDRDEITLAPNYQLRLGVPGASAGIQTAERLGLNAGIVAAARRRLGSQQVDLARFLDRLHNELTQLEEDRKAARAEQHALNQERARLAREGDVELRKRTRDLETKLASLLKDFEFQMRETCLLYTSRCV